MLRQFLQCVSARALPREGRRRVSRANSISTASSGAIPLTEARLNKFLEAELTHLRLKFEAPTPKELMGMVLGLETSTPEELMRFALSEVPKHFAYRLGELELLMGKRQFTSNTQLNAVSYSLPLLAGAGAPSKALAKACEVYRESFFTFRKFELRIARAGERKEYFAAFGALIQEMRTRHRAVVPQIAVGIVEMRHARARDDDAEAFNEQLGYFLDAFFHSRAFTEMITRQCLSMTQGSSIIQRDVWLKDVCQQAFEDAVEYVKMCNQVSNLPQEAIVDGEDVKFGGLHQYVHFILFEISKNSLEAYAQKPSKGQHLPMRFTCAADGWDCAVRVSDCAGGIPRSVQPHIWTYAYSSAPESHMSNGLGKPGFEQTPLAGWGCGLPIARLYAGLLGGSLSASVLPDHGVDMFLAFARNIKHHVFFGGGDAHFS